MPVSITRIFTFDAGHRVYGHESKCAHLHGHTYKAEVTVRLIKELDGLGRVVDFSVIKERVGTWIDENWDHNMILSPKDPFARWLSMDYPAGHENKKLPYVMPNNHPNPTAENIAKELLYRTNEVLSDHRDRLFVQHVRIWETPNCYADFWIQGVNELPHPPKRVTKSDVIKEQMKKFCKVAGIPFVEFEYDPLTDTERTMERTDTPRSYGGEPNPYR